MTKLKTIKEIDLRNEVIFKISKYLEDGTDMETINELLNIEYQKGHQTAKQEVIKLVKKKLEECRDKTDVWADEERWNKFEKMFKKELKSLSQETKLVDNKDSSKKFCLSREANLNPEKKISQSFSKTNGSPI